MQHEFSKPSPGTGKLDIKRHKPSIHLSVNKLVHSSTRPFVKNQIKQTKHSSNYYSDYEVFIVFHVNSTSTTTSFEKRNVIMT